MSDATYDTLVKNVNDLSTSLKTATDKLSALQNDANYTYYKSRLDRLIQGGYGANTWIDGGGTVWDGSDAKTGRAEGEAYVRDMDAQKATVQTNITDLKKSLSDAQKAVTDYQKNSPTVKASIASDILTSQKSETRKTLIVLGIVIFVILVGGAIIIISKRKKQNTQTT